MTFGSPMGYTVGMLVPVAILVVCAVFIPRALFNRMSPTLAGVVANLLLSTLLLVGVAAVLFAMLYMVQGSGVAAAIAERPLAALIEFLRLGASSALIWGPVLLIVLFGLAQRTDAR